MACGTDPARYISACSRGPTCSATSTTTASTTTSTTSTSTAAGCSPTPSNGGLIYGDFECGDLGPWIPSGIQSGFSVATGTPGLTGKRSVQGVFTGPAACKNSCSVGKIVSPPIPVTPGVAYKMTWATWMDGHTSGFVGVVLNGGGRTIDVYDYNQNEWRFNQYPWVAPAGTTSTTMFFDWYGPEARIDAVTLAPLTAYCGPNPPIGLLADGEFECGLGAWTQQVPDSNTNAGAKSTGTLQASQAYGNLAWIATTQGPNRSQQELGISARITSGAMPVTPGKSYMLAWTNYFNAFGIGFLGVKINGNAVMTVDPGDAHQYPGWFANTQYFWVAPAGVTTATVTFEAAFGSAGTIGVDSVIFVEAAQN